jgi:hypothetical protein
MMLITQNTSHSKVARGGGGENQEETDDSVEYEDQSSITFPFLYETVVS